MVVDLVEHSLDNQLGVIGLVDLGGQIVHGVLAVGFIVEFVLGFKTSFTGRFLELGKELVTHVIGVFDFLVGESNDL